MRTAVIMGPPRAGSTLLAHTINAHPQITCTDEARPYLAAARALLPLHAREGYGQQWEEILVPALRQSLVDFFTAQGTDETVYYIDKFPHYCDPTWGPGILESIDRLFPETRYIFLTRNEPAVVQSMHEVNRNHDWFEHSPKDLYHGIHRRAFEWERRVTDRMLRISYDDGLRTNVDNLAKFLDLPMAIELEEKVDKELSVPTRYSSPTSW